MTNMERKRKFTATCAEIKSELKAMDPLNVGIYDGGNENSAGELHPSRQLTRARAPVVLSAATLRIGYVVLAIAGFAAAAPFNRGRPLGLRF